MVYRLPLFSRGVTCRGGRVTVGGVVFGPRKACPKAASAWKPMTARAITNPRPFSATEILVLCAVAAAAALTYVFRRRRETDPATAVAYALPALTWLLKPLVARPRAVRVRAPAL